VADGEPQTSRSALHLDPCRALSESGAGLWSSPATIGLDATTIAPQADPFGRQTLLQHSYRARP